MTTHYTTRGGIAVESRCEAVEGRRALDELIGRLDSERGALFASSYEYPGRYTRWDIGFINPPLAITAREQTVEIAALNERGQVLLPAIAEALEAATALEHLEREASRLVARVRRTTERFPEEERSRQPTMFSVLRALLELFANEQDPYLGLYGAFGYDLVFQFEPQPLRLPRAADQRDLVIYLPDELLIVDHRKETAELRRYEFTVRGASTRDSLRSGTVSSYVPAVNIAASCDHEPGEYAKLVERAIQAFRRGDLFEVVPSQTFREVSPAPPSEVFRRLRERNPSPYGFLINLGAGEYLVGASPEMYVRVEGRRVETCPISGTIARGRNALEDAEQIRTLLNSSKDECELTMCTDVDRNDKSRICEPGSIRVIGRRQIELYSRVIHTVDHVEGTLRPGFDALDAFLTHAWAVTVTGAPKPWAMRFIEEHEKSPRRWYGGAVGYLGFNGNLNTGLTLRTVRMTGGVAEVRVGATLLYDSDPQSEEAETHIKAAALLDAIRRPSGQSVGSGLEAPRTSSGRRILLVDAEDSFVHTLANYLRQTGASVQTLRVGFDAAEIDRAQPDLVVLSPGPGRPSDFGLVDLIAEIRKRGLPLFGVCLGLQAITEAFGGELLTLDPPVHGKASNIRVLGGRLFEGFPATFRAGRYHSLAARRSSLPPELVVSAESEDGVVMALEHTKEPIAAVQFHPESIMTIGGELGLHLIANTLKILLKSA